MKNILILAVWLVEDFCTHWCFLPFIRDFQHLPLCTQDWRKLRNGNTFTLPWLLVISWLLDGWNWQWRSEQKFRAPCGFSALRGHGKLVSVMRKETSHNTIFIFPPARETLAEIPWMHFTGCISDGKPIQINNSTDTSVVILVRLSQLRENLICLLLTQVLQLYTPTETASMQSQSNPAWLDFVIFLEMECGVVQESLSCGLQSIAASGTARGHDIFKIFILLAALICIAKRYQMTKAVMEAWFWLSYVPASFSLSLLKHNTAWNTGQVPLRIYFHLESKCIWFTV